MLGAWLVLRVLLWESPFSDFAPARLAGEPLTDREATIRSMPVASAVPGRLALHESRQAPGGSPFALLRALTMPERAAPPPPYRATLTPFETTGYRPNSDCGGVASPEAACGIAKSEPVTAGTEFTRPADGSLTDPFVADQPQASRWSGDAWLFLRQDSAAPLAVGRPAYGRSQAGAVLRYRLAPSSSHRPVLYARATHALAGAREGELAAGFAARPVPGLPVSVSAELRIHDSMIGREVRPAAFAVTELPPTRLPGGLRGEAYAQAGYVGGTFATAFVDGQVRVDRRLALLGADADLRAGAAAWGGAQKHAERFDVGPSATVSFRLGEAYSRLTVDYRFRVAGDAEPGDGPALTFSAGF